MYIDNKHSIKIEFDTLGAKELIVGLQSAIENKSCNLQASYGATRKLINITFIKNDNDNNIILSEQNIDIELDIDEIEYAIERFIKSIDEKNFFPSEICEGDFNKKSVTIYAKYIEKL